MGASLPVRLERGRKGARFGCIGLVNGPFCFARSAFTAFSVMLCTTNLDRLSIFLPYGQEETCPMNLRVPYSQTHLCPLMSSETMERSCLGRRSAFNVMPCMTNLDHLLYAVRQDRWRGSPESSGSLLSGANTCPRNLRVPCSQIHLCPLMSRDDDGPTLRTRGEFLY